MGLSRITPRLFLPGVLLLFVSLFITHANGEARTRTTSDIENFLQRQGSKLFQGNEEYYSNLGFKMAELPFQGLVILTPKQIDLNKQHQFPVIVFSQNNGLRDWEVSEHLNLMLAIRDIHSGKLWMKRVLTSKKYEEQYGSREHKQGPKPNKLSATSISTGLENIDALTKFDDLLRTTSTLSITAICYDWISNTTQVELIGKQKQVVKPLPVSPRPAESKQTLPSYMTSSKSPKAHPDSLSFNIDQTATDSTHIVVQGSFSKKIHKHELLLSHETIRDHGTDQQIIGVVPITFAVLGLNWKYPRQRTINVPVYQTNTSGDRAQGYFHADIASPGLPPLDKGQYVVYAFIEEKVIGPQKLNVQ